MPAVAAPPAVRKSFSHDLAQRRPAYRHLGAADRPDAGDDHFGQYLQRQHARLCPQGRYAAGDRRRRLWPGREDRRHPARHQSVHAAGQLLGLRQSSQASVISTLLDQAQSLFGDPSDTSSIFASLDSVYSAFSNASATPSSSITRSQAVGALNSFLSSAGNLSDSCSRCRPRPASS
ncbi:MAG: hypothetical protein WDN45_12430 [Caulobacteraceae bacterium]